MFGNCFKNLKIFSEYIFQSCKNPLWQQVLASLCETCKIYLVEINCYDRIAKYFLPVISRISEN